MRMPWYKELRWLLAAKMILWAMNLIAREMSNDTAKAFLALGQNMKNDPVFDTVEMRPVRNKD